MKQFNVLMLILVMLFMTGFFVSPSAPVSSTQTATLTVLVCPQFVGGYEGYKNAFSTAFLVKVSNLNPSTVYKFAAGMIAAVDAADPTTHCYGSGYFYMPEYDNGGTYKWAPGFQSVASPDILPFSTEITTNATGEATFWVAIKPSDYWGFTENPLYLCITHNGGDGTNVTDLTKRLISDVSVGPAANTVWETAYDYAMIEGHTYASAGKYVFIYDRENPTAADRPLHGYMIENNALDENSGTDNNHQLSAPSPAFYSSNVNNQAGRYGLLYPIINTNGIRCIKIFNADGSTYSVVSDADGIWPSGLNTTTMVKGALYTISEADAPLPVELQTFTANFVQSQKKVILNWQTATEVNSYAFEVQRKSLDWINIGTVLAHGNSNSPKEYSFTDSQVPTGVIYYRLKMIDSDGSCKFGPTVAIKSLRPVNPQVNQNYPNPFNPKTTISYSLPKNSFVTLKVYNILGKEVAVLINGEQSAGNYSVDFDGNSLTSGTYVYRLSAGGKIATKKMILIK